MVDMPTTARDTACDDRTLDAEGDMCLSSAHEHAIPAQDIVALLDRELTLAALPRASSPSKAVVAFIADVCGRLSRWRKCRQLKASTASRSPYSRTGMTAAIEAVVRR